MYALLCEPSQETESCTYPNCLNLYLHAGIPQKLSSHFLDATQAPGGRTEIKQYGANASK